jgi:hypothetical protein
VFRPPYLWSVGYLSCFVWIRTLNYVRNQFCTGSQWNTADEAAAINYSVARIITSRFRAAANQHWPKIIKRHLVIFSTLNYLGAIHLSRQGYRAAGTRRWDSRFM